MNEVINAIKSRRSVRAYKPDKLKKTEIEAIVGAGTFAPSGHNAQAWHFSVIQDSGILSDINARTKTMMLAAIPSDWVRDYAQNPDTNVLHRAPALVIVSCRKDALTGDVDCIAAMQNMILAAESLGVGSCWMGFVSFLFGDAEEMKRLGVPEGYAARQAAVFGYPADGAKKDAPERKPADVSYIGEF